MIRQFLGLGLFLSVAVIPRAMAAEPWDAPFAKDTARILAAASAVAADADAAGVILLDEKRFSVDAQGRVTSVQRSVLRVVSADSVEELASLEAGYAPWYQKKPEVRARVLTTDGAVHWLDPKTETDAPARQFESSIFSDRRVVRAPLPAVAVGAVLEYEITVRETAPAFEAGSSWRLPIPPGFPVQRVHYVVEAARGVPLQTASQLIPEGTIRRSESKSGIRVECDWGPVPRKKEWEFSLPFDQAGQPVFEFSTGRSWQQVAARYAAVVDSRIGTPSMEGLAAPAQPGESARAIATRVVAALHKRVRYTGLELSDAAILPAAPAQVLARGYGDCKDKATLLVSALRAAGLDASVALLISGFGLDTNPDLPGFGGFDHAIVHVAGPEPLWIDATAQYTRVGTLPPGDQGRLALIAAPATTALVKTPESKSSENRGVHSVEVRLPEFGRAEFRETIEATGSVESGLRTLYGALDPAKVKETLEGQAKRTYLSTGLEDYTVTPGTDFSQPFRLTVSARNCNRGNTMDDQAVVGVFRSFIFSDLPFQVSPAWEDKAEQPARGNDFMLTAAYQMEYRYRIHYPAFLKPKKLPEDETKRAGEAHFQSSYRVDPGGFVEAVFRFDTGPRRLSPAQFADLRKLVKELWKDTPEVLQFVSVTGELLALGKEAEAVKAASGYAGAHPDSAAANARLSRVLLAAGAGEGARRAALKATELDAKSSQAWQALAWARQHDYFGRHLQGDWDAKGSEAAYRRAMEADADDLEPQLDLAVLLEHNTAGERYGGGSRLPEAIDLYRAALKKETNDLVRQNLVVALVWAGRYPDALTELKNLPATRYRSELSLLATALAQGADRAILDAQSEFPDVPARAAALQAAGLDLAKMRKYSVAVDLLRAAQRQSSNVQMERILASFRELKPMEQCPFAAGDARSLAWLFYGHAYTNTFDRAHLAPLMAQGAEPPDEAVMRRVRSRVSGARARLRGVGVSAEAFADTNMSTLMLENSGDETTGYRVTPRGAMGILPVLYIVREGGAFKVLATGENLAGLGRRALDRLKAGDAAGARLWLDLAIYGKSMANDKGPHSVVMAPVGAGDETPAAGLLWSGFVELKGGPEAIRIAAASLIGNGGASDEAIAMLKKARPLATNGLDRGNLDMALCQAYARAGRWNDLLLSARALTASFAVADKSFHYVAKARAGMNQWAELERDAAAILKDKPDNDEALLTAADAMLRAGQIEKAAGYVERIRKREFLMDDDHRLLARYALLAHKADETALSTLRKGVTVSSTDPGTEYLVGLLQIAAGHPDEARQSLAGAVGDTPWTELDARPFVLYGQIQSSYGNTEGAAAAYALARRRAEADAGSAWVLGLLPAAAKP